MDKGEWDLTSVKDTIKKCHRALVSLDALRSSSGNFQNWSQSEPFKTQSTFSQSQAVTLKSFWVKPTSWQIASTHSRTISIPFWTSWPPSSLPWMLQLQSPCWGSLRRMFSSLLSDSSSLSLLPSYLLSSAYPDLSLQYSRLWLPHLTL